jgi:hypothetical protein
VDVACAAQALAPRVAPFFFTMVQMDRISVKVLALLPDQTVPEHWHPLVDDDPGKEETIRVITGTVYSLNF